MSKENNSAKQIIKDYLEKKAKTDRIFAKTYAKKNKSIDECFEYILQEAKKRGSAVCMTDEEVFGLAVHYYDEDTIQVNGKHSSNVKVQTSVSKPTPAQNLTSAKKKPQENEMPSLFDFI